MHICWGIWAYNLFVIVFIGLSLFVFVCPIVLLMIITF